VLLSLNPKAGRGSAARRVDRLVELLRGRDFQVGTYTDLAEVSAEANRLHAEGRLRALVGVGGDGTAAELANRTNEGVPLTLLAAGTANLLAKHLRLSGKPERLCQTIVDGHLRRLDAGRANGRLFLVVLGCGFDADVVQRVHTHRESNPRGAHISYFSYLKPILRSIRSYQYPEIRVYCEASCDEAAEAPPITARWVFICNLPRYGWGLPLAPRADGEDGRLDLCTFRRGSLLRGLWYAAAAQLGGSHRRLADCVVRQAPRFRITSEAQVEYELDGDPGGMLPLDVEVVPNRVTVVVAPPKRDSD
jgi:diacylglycerol kinase family enzyme